MFESHSLRNEFKSRGFAVGFLFNRDHQARLKGLPVNLKSKANALYWPGFEFVVWFSPCRDHEIIPLLSQQIQKLFETDSPFS